MQAFVVADVHGFYDEMIEALNKAGYDKDNPKHCFVSLGDLLDRGSKPKECLEFVNSIPESNKILIRGNHEDLIQQMIDRGTWLYHDLSNGTAKTAVTLTNMNPLEVEPEHILNALSVNTDLTTYLNSCIDFYENDKLIFVHGWIPCVKSSKYLYNPDWRNASRKEWEDARWICGADAWHCGINELPDKTIWCGHWHTSYAHSKYHNEGCEWDEGGQDLKADFTPFVDLGIVCMDACTAYSGFVNCKKIGRFKK